MTPLPGISNECRDRRLQTYCNGLSFCWGNDDDFDQQVAVRFLRELSFARADGFFGIDVRFRDEVFPELVVLISRNREPTNLAEIDRRA